MMIASHSHRSVSHFSRHCSIVPSCSSTTYHYYGLYINIFYNRLNSEILCVRFRMCSADGNLEEILLLACKYLLSCVGGKKNNESSMGSGAGVMGGGMGMDSKGGMSGGTGMKSGGMGSTMKSGGFGSMGGAGMKGGAMGSISMGGGAGGMKGG